MSAPASGARRVLGKGASPGRAAGPAHVVGESSPERGVPLGAILVTRILHPHLAPLLPRVAGLVVEEGSLLQHATTLAREFGVPAVVGVRDAMTLFGEGELLEIDGTSGAITVLQSEGS